MSTQSSPLNRYGLYAGLFLGLLPTLYHIGLYALSLHLDYRFYGEGIGIGYERANLPLLPLTMIYALIKFKKANGKILKLGQVFQLWIRVFVMSALVVIAYNLIFRMLVVPDFASDFYALNRDQIFNELIMCCDYSPEQLEQHEQTNGALWNKLSAYLLGSVVFGGLTSLIAGLFLRSRNQRESTEGA